MPKKAGVTAISIPPIEQGRMNITIEGTSSLLCNRKTERAMTTIRDKQQGKAQGARGAKDAQALYKESMYLTEDGKAGFPASGIKKACVDACSFIAGVSKVTARGAFYVLGDVVPIRGKPKIREDAVIVGMRAVDLRYRAEFKEWEIGLEIQYNARVLTPEAIVNLLENAGLGIGIGDWRPQKNGNHGMFRVKKE